MNVKFYSVKLKSTFNALETKDPLSLYWIIETSELYKGDQLFGTGALATQSAAGLLSPEDKAKLDSLVAGSVGLSSLTPVDGTVVITGTEDGGKAIGVAISAQNGNILTAVDGGLFVPSPEKVNVPDYAIEKQETAEDGFSVSYKLKKTVNGEVSYVGDTINIAKDMVLQSASLEIVAENDVPYVGAVVGDPYIKMTFNDAENSSIYVPVKGLVDNYVTGDGIEIIGNKVSVKIAAESHGLTAVDGSMTMLLVTAKQDGAMSKEDKAFIDSIPDVYATIDRVKDTVVGKKFEITSTPVGTLVNYGEHEIRIMCPADTQWKKQNVGANGLPNRYYVGFKAYAPEGAVSFKEDVKPTVEDQTMWYFENNPTAGTDKYGRKYSIVWISVAEYDEVTDKWTYFGADSTVDEYFCKHYSVEWYDANGVCIGFDYIRINLTNENCHMVTVPYYMSGYATGKDIEELRETLSGMGESYTWGEM